MASRQTSSGKNDKGMSNFNGLVANTNLTEISLSNGMFTWARDGNVASRSLIDTFLTFKSKKPNGSKRGCKVLI